MKKQDIKIDLSGFERNNRNTSWEKAVWGAILISVVLYLGACGYIFFKPLASNIQSSIDTEVSSTGVSFDQKTIDMLNSRQTPPETTATTGGKNPFTPF